jgi:serine phosphatase RsbU (regulator of sigma subunit)
MQNNSNNQRDTYKLVEKLISGKITNKLSLLKSLVKDIIKTKEFGIVSGRIWELNSKDLSYSLKFQLGSSQKIPLSHTLSIADQPILSKFSEQRTILNYETDELLKQKGVQLFSAIGVGELVRLKTGKFYEYVIGFSAPEIQQAFYETLNIISSVSTVALKNLSDQVAHKKIKKDIYRASEIQKNLFPDHAVSFYDYDVFGVCIPDSEVGGDYFDYIRSTDQEEERLGIVISDASSKGLPAAVQSLFLSGALKMGMGFAPKISSIFSKLNNLIHETFFYERFVTLFYCDLTLTSNRLVLYANAGHCSPLHYHAPKDKFKSLDPTGGFLGIMPNQKYKVENINMKKGDVLVLFTDGITEAQDEEGNLFGEERMKDIIRKYHASPANIIAYAILEEVENFSANGAYNDDKTLVVIKRNEEELVSE